MIPIILIQAGTPPDGLRAAHGDLPDWFAAALGHPPARVIRAFEGEALPDPDAGTGAIITGSWAMVTDRKPWSEALAGWIRRAMTVRMPLFGVCYGHQLMADALGGAADYHPQGREIGSRTVTLTDRTDPATRDLPQSFAAHLTHMQTVTALPPRATVLARSDHDPHQILRYGPRAMSTQFHPEFTPAIMAGIIRSRDGVLRNEGRDPDALLAAVQPADTPARLMRDFFAKDTTCAA